MNTDNKAENERIWNGFKPAVDALTADITAFYASLGSTRQCRHINELWRSEAPVIGIGFVPPEAKEELEPLIVNSGLHLHKGNGPLGRGVYFGFLYDAQLTEERLHRLAESVRQKTKVLEEIKPARHVDSPPTAEMVIEDQVARMEGMHTMPADKIRTRPSEAAAIIDTFNSATAGMPAGKALGLLALAVPYLNLPDIARQELLHTVTMMRDAEFEV